MIGPRFVIRRLYVTLLELLIVMVVVALVAGIMAIGIDKALLDQRFRNEVSMIVDDLRLAQELMMIVGADVHLVFKAQESGEGIQYLIKTEAQMTESIQRILINKKRELKTIHGVFFKDELERSNAPGEIDVKFISKGIVMSKGIMRLALSSKEELQGNGLENFICLPGYPQLIVSKDTKEEAEAECREADNEAFNKMVSHDTYERLPDKLKQPIKPEEENKQPPPPKQPPESTNKQEKKSKQKV